MTPIFEISNQEFAEFLRNKPLYTKVKAVTVNGHTALTFNWPGSLYQRAFKFLCPVEKELQTFRTQPPVGSHPFLRNTMTDHNDERIPEYFDEHTGKLDLITEVAGCCQSCGAIISFLIRRFSDKVWDDRKSGLSIFLQKVGQYPPFDIRPEKEIQKYLTEEDLDSFKKALICLSNGYGIGAFAYFRRVIENELRRIISDITLLEFDGVEKVREAFKSFEINHQMNNLIIALSGHFPGALKIGSENPIQLLYQQLSIGIHSLTEDECISRAESIKILLTFVIKKVNEERFVIGDVAQAIRNLRL